MRFMMLMIPKGYAAAEEDALPDPKLVAEMAKFNGALQKAGVLISLDGLHPSQKGARVRFSMGKPSVIHGPFPGVQEILGGYWMINVKSRDEAVAWAMQCPAQDGDAIEIRQVQEMEDFPQELQEAAQNPAIS